MKNNRNNKQMDAYGELSSYLEWRRAHPIRAWAKKNNVSIAALSAKIRVSPQHLNGWMQRDPPEDDRFDKLATIMGLKPEKLRAAISAWRDLGRELQI